MDYIPSNNTNESHKDHADSKKSAYNIVPYMQIQNQVRLIYGVRSHTMVTLVGGLMNSERRCKWRFRGSDKYPIS